MSDDNVINVDPRVEMEFIKLQAKCWQMVQQIEMLAGKVNRLRARTF